MKNIISRLKYGDPELVEVILVVLLITLGFDTLKVSGNFFVPILIWILGLSQLISVLADFLKIKVVLSLIIGIFFVYLGFTLIKDFKVIHSGVFWFIKGLFSFWCVYRVQSELTLNKKK